MRIAVLATGWAKKELLSKAISSTVELTFLDSLGDMILSRNADIFFDLDFVFDKERINKLGQLLPKPVFVNSSADVFTAIWTAGKPESSQARA